MRNSRHARYGVSLLLAVGSVSLHAEPPNASAALARAQGMLRQLNDAKQQLELDNAKLKASNASLEQELKISRLNIGAREADIAARGKELSEAKSGQTRLETRNTQITTRLKEVVAKYKEVARTAQELEAAKEQLEGELKSARADLADAQEKNRAMYQTSGEILERFKHKSRWTALLQKEPFTGIKQVEVESTVEAYEGALQEQLHDRNLDAAHTANGLSD